jgi:hypothetical protein
MFAVLVGLGILTMALFPFALPGLLLVVAPLAVLAVAGLLLALPLVLPLWVVRIAIRSRSRRRAAGIGATEGSQEARAVARAAQVSMPRS